MGDLLAGLARQRSREPLERVAHPLPGLVARLLALEDDPGLVGSERPPPPSARHSFAGPQHDEQQDADGDPGKSENQGREPIG